jgi:tetratricopeptide (TPR) repeat protein
LIPGLAIVDSAYIAPTFLATLGKLFARVGAVDTARALLDELASRVAATNDDDRAAREYLEGEIALAEGDAESALASFEQAALLPNQPNYVYLAALARTRMRLGDLDAARATLETIVAGTSSGRESQEPWVLAHYDLATLYDGAGETSQAIDAYRGFLAIWDMADEGLEPVALAQRRLAELTGRDPPR